MPWFYRDFRNFLKHLPWFCHFYRDFLLSLNMSDRFNRIPVCDRQTDRWRTSCENIVHAMHTSIAWLKMNLLYLLLTATNLVQCWQLMVRRINTSSFVKCLKQRTSWRFPWGRQNRLVNSNWRPGWSYQLRRNNTLERQVISNFWTVCFLKLHPNRFSVFRTTLVTWQQQGGELNPRPLDHWFWRLHLTSRSHTKPRKLTCRNDSKRTWLQVRAAHTFHRSPLR